MKRTRLITGVLLLVALITVAVVASADVTNTNTEDSLPIQTKSAENNSSIVIESNDSVKITKKKSKKKKKKNKKSKSKLLGTYKVTGYCSCSNCCGKSNGVTASGTVAKAGRTVAADTSKLPFGTKVVIDGHTYTVEDKGGAINGNRIDIFFSSHSKALQWGVRYCKVYAKK